MVEPQTIRELFDLTDPHRNIIFGMSVGEARKRVADGDIRRIREIDGHFALVARRGQTVRLARSLQLPMRYFIVKQSDGPALVVTHRIDAIKAWLDERGLGDQFHPSYTRMVPAHHLTDVDLLDGEASAVELPAGSVLYFHRDLVHGSQTNRSNRSRRVFVAAYQPPGLHRWRLGRKRPIKPAA